MNQTGRDPRRRICMTQDMRTTDERHSTRPDEPVRVDVTRRPPGAGGWAGDSTAPEAVAERRRRIEQLLAPGLEGDLERVRKLANLLDTRFNVAGVRFGWDSLVGLIPVVGDTVTTLIGLYPLAVARKHRLGKWVQARMGMNLLGDWLVGLVPLAGDLFDLGFKANVRNLKLLEAAVEKTLRTRSPSGRG
jgi:hypothetical protein